MKKEFLELKTLKTAMTALSEGLSIMALEKVDSLYANSRQAMVNVLFSASGNEI